MKSPLLSICVCCRNASARIEDTLLSLYHQSADKSSYEILVVDNDSDDFEQLKALVEQTRQNSPSVKLISEPNVGLSYARNRAVKESRGEYIVFIDDDAVANLRLVEHYIRSVREHQPDVFGGNVLPLFDVRPPIEVEGHFWPQWSLKHFGKIDRWLENGEYFIGTNIGASRRNLISNPFSPQLGRKEDRLTGGEEWYLGKSRYKRRFVAGAYVLHKVPESRMSSDYLAKRYCDFLKQKKQSTNLLKLFLEWLILPVKEFKLFYKKIFFLASLKYKIWQQYKMNG